MSDDILNIQGHDIPAVDDELEKLLEKGKTTRVSVLPGASDKLFKRRKPYAVTEVSISFDDEEDLRICVRLLRWSDQRLIDMGSSILWAWNKTYREGMKINFAVNWYDRDFFEKRQDALSDDNHLSYFKMFGASASDMNIATRILATGA